MVVEKETWDAGTYDAQYAFIWQQGRGVVELLDPQPGERILDLGCGTGHLTHEIASAGAEVTGVDVSPEMITEARRNYPDVRFEVAAGQDMRFDAPFDAVFSNAAIHWMKEPGLVVESIARALRPGGRFVAEFGGKGNVRRVIEAVLESLRAAGYPDGPELVPWYYPSIGEYAALLEAAGLETTFSTLFDRPTPLDNGEQGLARWLEMFCDTLLAGVPAGRRPALIADVEQRLRPDFYRDGQWTADYRRLRVVAVKTE